MQCLAMFQRMNAVNAAGEADELESAFGRHNESYGRRGNSTTLVCAARWKERLSFSGNPARWRIPTGFRHKAQGWEE
jgi:hypothetical protein